MDDDRDDELTLDEAWGEATDPPLPDATAGRDLDDGYPFHNGSRESVDRALADWRASHE